MDKQRQNTLSETVSILNRLKEGVFYHRLSIEYPFSYFKVITSFLKLGGCT